MVPFVHYAGARAGLGQASTVAIAPSPLPWWQQIAIPVGQSVGSAVSSRIAHGKQPSYFPYGTQSGFFYQPGGPEGGGPYFGSGFGGFDPRTLLLLGVGVAALMFLRR